MVLTVIGAIVVVVAVVSVILWRRRLNYRRLLEVHTILPEDLHRILEMQNESQNETQSRPRVYDVRQPLDLLAYSEIIPGSERIAPKEILANPSLISKTEEAIVYCTCPGDKTAIEIVLKAASMDFLNLRILKGGLEAWKAKGYPVERYEQSFHLDTPA